jgi:hypothetical protein
MERPIDEVQRRREAGNLLAGRAVVIVGEAHPGPDRHPTLHLLRLVRAQSGAQRRGPAEAPKDCQPAPRRVWNRLPDTVAEAVVTLGLKKPELSPRALAIVFAEQQQYFVSEASVYRLLKAHDLITSPAFILMKAADRFAQPTTAPTQLWQTDSTYLRVIGWG